MRRKAPTNRLILLGEQDASSDVFAAPTYRPLKDATDDELTTPHRVKMGKTVKVATKSQIERSRFNARPNQLILLVGQEGPNDSRADPNLQTLERRDR